LFVATYFKFLIGNFNIILNFDSQVKGLPKIKSCQSSFSQLAYISIWGISKLHVLPTIYSFCQIAYVGFSDSLQVAGKYFSNSALAGEVL
jgi:hypothetical protein